MTDDSLSFGTDKTDKAVISAQKKPYFQLALRTYGTVTEFTNGTMTNGSDSGPARKNSQSDLKENIVRIGDHPLGIGLYLFDYKPEFRDRCGHGRRFGVMADEVEQVVPEAVSVDQNGYKQVDYALLGIAVTRH